MARFTWITLAQFEGFAANNTDAHRLCSGPSGWAERLGEDALVCFKNDRARGDLLAALDELPWKPRRIFGKFLPRQNADRVCPELLRGKASLSLETEVTESGVRYGLDFAAGYSHGLFLDQRANRAFVGRSAPTRVLNTFAYTCSFSVVAALAGAETVNVDLSRKSLDRGRTNFALNGLDPSTGHRFVADDVLEVIPRLQRRGEKFDVVILDPPTFSRGNKGRLWKVEEQFDALLASVVKLLAPGGRVLLSTNCTAFDGPLLEKMVRDCLWKFGRRGVFHREPTLEDFPSGHSATTLWMTLR